MIVKHITVRWPFGMVDHLHSIGFEAHISIGNLKKFYLETKVTAEEALLVVPDTPAGRTYADSLWNLRMIPSINDREFETNTIRWSSTGFPDTIAHTIRLRCGW